MALLIGKKLGSSPRDILKFPVQTFIILSALLSKLQLFASFLLYLSITIRRYTSLILRTHSFMEFSQSPYLWLNHLDSLTRGFQIMFIALRKLFMGYVRLPSRGFNGFIHSYSHLVSPKVVLTPRCSILSVGLWCVSPSLR